MSLRLPSHVMSNIHFPNFERSSLLFELVKSIKLTFAAQGHMGTSTQETTWLRDRLLFVFFCQTFFTCLFFRSYMCWGQYRQTNTDWMFFDLDPVVSWAPTWRVAVHVRNCNEQTWFDTWPHAPIWRKLLQTLEVKLSAWHGLFSDL